MPDIVNLPENFIGKDDEQRLESFGAHLIAHGRATRWHWNREHGIDVAFEILAGGTKEHLVVSIVRDRKRDRFVAKDARGAVVGKGALDRVMAAVDRLAGMHQGNQPA
ncbi:MAG TPA: hypothetical protein VFY39_06270 [Gammaproteobacteria bacterium]|nr:hypothetical protein [Gammaproteobacteria bacterium]